jgi:DNA-binding transcriptional MerR regulator
MTLRGVDLARAAGLSVQQIRNYVDVGLLPPAGRAANGYRIFTDQHVEALAVARTLLDTYGWELAVRAMTAVHRGDPATAAAIADRAHAQLDSERSEVTGLLRAFDGDLPPDIHIRRPLRIGDAAAIAGVRPSALRVWEDMGLLTPGREPGTGYRTYDQTQVVRARVTALLRATGYSLPAAKDVMDAMRDGDPARTRDALQSRLRDLDDLSRRRLRATAALSAYLDSASAEC